MATGDQNDFLARIGGLIPNWFSDSNPILNALLSGIAWAKAHMYSMIMYAALQTRIKTATDGWLDMIAYDFFGSSILRNSTQSDASFRNTIIINLFRERATRNGLIKVLTDLTGNAPLVFEPSRPLDTGVYGGPMIGYGAAGGYGSLNLPFQAFVTVFRAAGTGIPNVAGYGISTGGYGQASQAEYSSLDMIEGAVTDEDIYSAIESVKPVGTRVWARISN